MISDDIKVTPRVGVWIETQLTIKGGTGYKSLPAWECGLKRALYVFIYVRLCHSPRGSVD